MSALIDEERRDKFEGGDVSQPNFTSAYYLTLQWLPPVDDTSKASALFYEGGSQGVATAADHLDDFERETGRLLDIIEGVMPEAAWLSDAETLTYLHSTISTHAQRIAVPTLMEMPKSEAAISVALYSPAIPVRLAPSQGRGRLG